MRPCLIEKEIPEANAQAGEQHMGNLESDKRRLRIWPAPKVIKLSALVFRFPFL